MTQSGVTLAGAKLGFAVNLGLADRVDDLVLTVLSRPGRSAPVDALRQGSSLRPEWMPVCRIHFRRGRQITAAAQPESATPAPIRSDSSATCSNRSRVSPEACVPTQRQPTPHEGRLDIVYSLLDFALTSFRRSRAPLSSGALVALAIWIQVADLLSDDWPGSRFATQLSALFSSLQTVGLGMLLLLVVGVAGSLATRTSRLLLDPPMRWFVASWQERKDVREHLRRNRPGPFEIGGSEAEFAELLEAERRQYVRNTIVWLLDWFPRRDAYIKYTRKNLWLKPKWDRKILGWIAGEVYNNLHHDKRLETPAELRRRLRKDNSLQSAILSLEGELERNPAAPFTGDQESDLVTRLDTLSSENEYRLAVMPSLIFLLVGIGISWWYWALFVIPLPLLIYGSSLSKQDDVPVLALGWLLDGRGTSHSLEELRLWATREADRINQS